MFGPVFVPIFGYVLNVVFYASRRVSTGFAFVAV